MPGKDARGFLGEPHPGSLHGTMTHSSSFPVRATFGNNYSPHSGPMAFLLDSPTLKGSLLWFDDKAFYTQRYPIPLSFLIWHVLCFNFEQFR